MAVESTEQNELWDAFVEQVQGKNAPYDPDTLEVLKERLSAGPTDPIVEPHYQDFTASYQEQAEQIPSEEEFERLFPLDGDLKESPDEASADEAMGDNHDLEFDPDIENLSEIDDPLSEKDEVEQEQRSESNLFDRLNAVEDIEDNAIDLDPPELNVDELDNDIPEFKTSDPLIFDELQVGQLPQDDEFEELGQAIDEPDDDAKTKEETPIDDREEMAQHIEDLKSQLEQQNMSSQGASGKFGQAPAAGQGESGHSVGAGLYRAASALANVAGTLSEGVDSGVSLMRNWGSRKFAERAEKIGKAQEQVKHLIDHEKSVSAEKGQEHQEEHRKREFMQHNEKLRSLMKQCSERFDYLNEPMPGMAAMTPAEMAAEVQSAEANNTNTEDNKFYQICKSQLNDFIKDKLSDSISDTLGQIDYGNNLIASHLQAAQDMGERLGLSDQDMQDYIGADVMKYASNMQRNSEVLDILTKVSSEVDATDPEASMKLNEAAEQIRETINKLMEKLGKIFSASPVAATPSM